LETPNHIKELKMLSPLPNTQGVEVTSSQ